MAIETDRDLVARYASGAYGWSGLRSSGIEIGPNGELSLRSVPDAGTPAGPALSPPADGKPAGCAVDECGEGWISDPDTSRVLRITRCVPGPQPDGDVVGSGSAGDTELLPGAFGTPRGIVSGPRGRLYVADAAASQVVVVEPGRGMITARWIGFIEPWCLTASGPWVYALDRGGPGGLGRVRRFDTDGVEDAAYTAAAAAVLGDAVRMALAGDVLLVVCRGAAADTVVPLRSDGMVDAGSQAAWAAPERVERDPRTGAPVRSPATRIGGVAGTADRAYLIDSGFRDLLTFTAAGQYIGTTRPARALTDVWGADSVLWARPAEPGPMSRHAVDGARLRYGAFVCGPLDTATEDGRRELRVRYERVAGGHLQLWTAVTPGDVAPNPQTIPISPADTSTYWTSLPADVDVALVAGPVGPKLFVGGQLGGDGRSSPRVRQLAVSGARRWLDLLPAVYRKDAARGAFLDRYLRLVHSVAEETAQERADLVRRFGAWTADDPPGGDTTALEELAAWLDVSLDERWSQDVRRGVVGGAFAAQVLRGTPLGLKAAAAQRLGLHIEISEPAQRAHVWSLEGDGATGLGFDTMLVGGPPDGAIVGATAVVGHSDLTGGVDAGAPLFADLAHRFCVFASGAGLDLTALEPALRALVDAEKPAHTVYSLCLAEPRARVGAQARVGVDLILAGPPPPLELDTAELQDATLAAEPSVLAGQLRLGRSVLR